jgi:CRP-like cAMP-binding protein
MIFAACYLFEGLSEAQFHRLAAIAREIPMQKGQWHFQEGKEAKELYVLKEGAVELLTRVDDRFELPITILRTPGDCFGASAILAPYVYSLSARCAEDGVLFAIAHGTLQQLIRENHGLGCILMRNLAQHLLNRLRETRQELKTHFSSLFKFTH